MTRVIYVEKSVRPLEAYFEDSRRLGVEDFGRQHGGAFLVHHGPVGQFEPPGDLKSTMKVEAAVTGDAIPFNPSKDFAVFPVRHGVAGASFESVQIGVRAHIQHLKAYASREPLQRSLVDPRFGRVRRGSAPYVEDLSGKWAVDPHYAAKIRRKLQSLARRF